MARVIALTQWGPTLGACDGLGTNPKSLPLAGSLLSAEMGQAQPVCD